MAQFATLRSDAVRVPYACTRHLGFQQGGGRSERREKWGGEKEEERSDGREIDDGDDHPFAAIFNTNHKYGGVYFFTSRCRLQQAQGDRIGRDDAIVRVATDTPS
jgi:hypothetical protein